MYIEIVIDLLHSERSRIVMQAFLRYACELSHDGGLIIYCLY